MDPINKYRPYIILVLFLLISSILAFIFSSGQSRFQTAEPTSFDEGWVWVDGMDVTPIPSLPTKLDVEAGQSITISNILPEEFHVMKTIMVRTSLQDVKVEVDGFTIYEKYYQDDSKLPPYASMWHMIEVPIHSEGRTITITLSSPYEAMSGTLNYLFYGETSQLYAYMFRTYGYRLAVGLFVLLAGLLMMIVSFFIKKGEGLRYTYLGLFAVTLSFWIIAESRMIQWFTGNEFIIGSLAYISLAIFPIPMLYYLKNYIVFQYKHLYHVLIGIFYVQSILITVFHAFDISDYFESVIYTQVFLVIGIIVVITTLVLEMVRNKSTEARKVLKYFSFLLVFVLIELINFIIGNFEDTSVFALTGVGLLMVLMLINYVSYLIGRLKLSYEKELYERLAYQDWLTGGKNRLKFELDYDIYFKDEVLKKQLRLIYFDLDYLKQVNDQYGHQEGDQIIKKGFELIESNFGGFGSCYRIGGDEFSCLVLGMDDLTYKTMTNAFRSEILAYDETLPYDFRISMGTSMYQDGIDRSPDTMMKRADDDMYWDKCSFKGTCKRPQKE
jgi:diguanylate cyclase (GGDEF)-like protein